MRRIVAWMMALLLCVVGTGCGRQLGGRYPMRILRALSRGGLCPKQEDLGRAPYSYAGAGPHFSVVLNGQTGQRGGTVRAHTGKVGLSRDHGSERGGFPGAQ